MALGRPSGWEVPWPGYVLGTAQGAGLWGGNENVHSACWIELWDLCRKHVLWHQQRLQRWTVVNFVEGANLLLKGLIFQCSLRFSAKLNSR